METTQTTYRVTIDSTIAPKLREWFSANRGVRRWINAEIGNPRPDMFTPGDNEAAPHWAYPLAGSQLLTPDLIDVEEFQERTRFRTRIKSYYWGPGLSEVSENKAKMMLRAGEKFYWEWDNPGYAFVIIGPSVIKPFTLA